MRLFSQILAIGCLIVAFSIGFTPARAADATVTDCTNFTGAGSISEAVNTANSGGGTISITCTGTITFTNQLIIDATVIINNDSGGAVTFDGGGTTRFFTVNPFQNLTLNGFTLQNGNANFGGAIRTNTEIMIGDGTLTITNCTFINNSAAIENGEGGAIANYGMIVTLSNTTFINNFSRVGAAIFNGGTMIITNNTFLGNTGIFSGAIHNGAQMTITNSTFTGNSAESGGGIFNNATLTLETSTFTDNIANEGGAIYNTSIVFTPNRPILNDTASSGGGISNLGSLGSLYIESQNSHYKNNTCVGTPIIDNGGNTRDANSLGCPGTEVLGTEVSGTKVTVLGCALDTTDGVEVAGAPDNTYCRILMKNGGVVSYSGAIPADLVGLGVILAVDVYRLEGGATVNTFPAYSRVCLAGSGRLFYMDGRNAPRYSVELASESIDGLTCGWIPAPGTLILTN